MDERAVKTLRDIGPAVLNGGFSTFLAFFLTAGSTSHVFSTFFKVSARKTLLGYKTNLFQVFFLVAVFGLYHALVFLPVMLSLCGSVMKSATEEETDDNKQTEDGNCGSVSSVGIEKQSFSRFAPETNTEFLFSYSIQQRIVSNCNESS